MEQEHNTQEMLKVTEDYKKAYNHADIICRHRPELLDQMKSLKNVSPEYSQGFGDRVAEYRIQKDAIKNFSYRQLAEKYGKDMERYMQKQSRNQSKTKRK